MQRLYLVLGTINNILLEIMQITGMFQCKRLSEMLYLKRYVPRWSVKCSCIG